MAKRNDLPVSPVSSPPLPRWYRLDNAAKIYPATKQRDRNSIYRVCVTLDKNIMPDILAEAIKDLQPRFPAFFVQLRRGFFWYYFEPADSVDVVEEERTYPCRPIPVEYGTKPVFRVLYYKDRISLEVFHAVADGTGTMTFLKALILRYLSLCGYDMESARWTIPDVRDDPVASEINDSFLKYYQNVGKLSRKEPRAFTYRVWRDEDERYLRVINGSFSVESVKWLAGEKGVTLTQYLTALYILSFANNMSRSAHKRPVRISVPVDLRRHFPSTTLRNFSLYVNVGLRVDLDIGIDEILAAIVPQMVEGLRRDRLLQVFSQNVRAERTFVLRIAPLFIKNFVLKAVYKIWGDNRFTSTFSNLGLVELPPSMGAHVRELGFALGVSPSNPISASGISYNGRMTVCFSSCSPESGVQTFFFRYLSQNGVEVEVESNV